LDGLGFSEGATCPAALKEGALVGARQTADKALAL
jgi:hypothetical protein